jgi:flagellar motor switch protein FliM
MLARLRSSDREAERGPKQLNGAQIERMFYSLPLKLQGRIASLNLTVAQLSNIEAGDIIPISLNDPLPVYIGKEQIFNAVIADDRGKLFLSEFNDKTIEKSYE